MSPEVSNQPILHCIFDKTAQFKVLLIDDIIYFTAIKDDFHPYLVYLTLDVEIYVETFEISNFS